MAAYLWCMNRILISLLFFLLVFQLPQTNAQNKGIQISILTCAPGKDIYSIYGHNAIRILNPDAGTDLVYNYGTFDFKTKGFIVKFMRGKLPYVLDVADYGRFLAEYDYFERSVTEQVLSLDSVQTHKIIAYLDNNMLPENRTYKYDFFMDNCATRLRDIIEKNVESCTWSEMQSTEKSFRDIIKEYQKNMPWTDFGIDLIIGAPADRLATYREKTFIPDYLAVAIQDAKCASTQGQKLEASQQKILNFDNAPGSINFLLTPYFLFGLLLLLEIIFFFNIWQPKASLLVKYDHLWLGLMAICSLLMIFMWFGTDHIPTKNNWNVLWASPLLIIWWIMNKENPYRKIVSYLILAMLTISMINALPFLRILPQYFHPVVAIISLILILKIVRLTFR